MKTAVSCYLDKIIEISFPYLKNVFSQARLEEFLNKAAYLKDVSDEKKTIKEFSDIYIKFVKEDYQQLYQNTNQKLIHFLEKKMME